MNDLDNFTCDQANKLLDLYLDPLDNPEDGEIERATRRYIAGVLTPLFEPIAVMPPGERAQVLHAVIELIRSTTYMMAETALKHEVSNDAGN